MLKCSNAHLHKCSNAQIKYSTVQLHMPKYINVRPIPRRHVQSIFWFHFFFCSRDCKRYSVVAVATSKKNTSLCCVCWLVLRNHRCWRTAARERSQVLAPNCEQITRVEEVKCKVCDWNQMHKSMCFYECQYLFKFQYRYQCECQTPNAECQMPMPIRSFQRPLFRRSRKLLKSHLIKLFCVK